jgi:hypothetical protein
MGQGFVIALDLSILVAAAASGVFWYLASRNHLRRISRTESLDAADINRIVVAFNRAQILNRRAALTTAVAALLAVGRLALDLL